MREQTITWYTPEEKLPEEKANILFKEDNNNIDDYVYSGCFLFERFDSDYQIFNPKRIKEWCYIDKH